MLDYCCLARAGMPLMPIIELLFQIGHLNSVLEEINENERFLIVNCLKSNRILRLNNCGLIFFCFESPTTRSIEAW